jgi:hypothetical protein
MPGASLPRRRAGNVAPSWIPKFKSAEHQTMVFAAALLINDDTARSASSPEEVSVQAGVSVRAARIYFEQVQEGFGTVRRRHGSAADCGRGASGPGNRSRPPRRSHSQRPLLLPWSAKTISCRHKFMCHARDTIYDRFQDRDGLRQMQRRRHESPATMQPLVKSQWPRRDRIRRPKPSRRCR